MLEIFSHKSSILFTPKLFCEENRFSLHFPFGSHLHKETAYFLSTVGDDGSASAPQLRRFSLQFCDVLYQNEYVLKNVHINPRYFSLLMKKKKKIVLVFIFPLEDYTHILPTIGDDGIRQVPSAAAILAAVLRFSLPK